MSMGWWGPPAEVSATLRAYLAGSGKDPVPADLIQGADTLATDRDRLIAERDLLRARLDEARKSNPAPLHPVVGQTEPRETFPGYLKGG
jgi:hypothetical protein